MLRGQIVGFTCFSGSSDMDGLDSRALFRAGRLMLIRSSLLSMHRTPSPQTSMSVVFWFNWEVRGIRGKRKKLFGFLGLLGIFAGTACVDPGVDSDDSDLVPNEIVVDQSPDGESEFFRVDLGEGAYVSFGYLGDDSEGYAERGGLVDMLAVGGARLDRLLDTEGVAEASLAEIYYGLGGSVEQAPSRVRLELEQRTVNYNVRFAHGELLETLPSVPLIEDIEPHVIRSEYCDLSEFYDFSLRHFKADSTTTVYQRYTNRPSALGVKFGRMGRVSGNVCNKETSGGTPRYNDRIKVSWLVGYMTGTPRGDGRVFTGQVWMSRYAEIPDGFRAAYTVSVADDPLLVSPGVEMQVGPMNDEKRRYYSALYADNLTDAQ